MLNRKRAIRSKILSEPLSRLNSLQEIEVAAELGIRIDVNRASVDEWLRLPGISIHQARALVELIGMGLQILSIEDLAHALSMPLSHVQYWQPVLSFCYYPPESLSSRPKIDVNSATVEQLQNIPGMDGQLAQKIMGDRTSNGRYPNLVSLQKRLNLTSEKVWELMPYISW